MFARFRECSGEVCFEEVKETSFEGLFAFYVGINAVCQVWVFRPKQLVHRLEHQQSILVANQQSVAWYAFLFLDASNDFVCV